MALFKITFKRSGTTNGVKYEKGMSVEVASSSSNPVLSNGGQDVRDAFLRIHGIDLKKANTLSTTYLEVKKIN
ncbi:MAG: hypothetical protein H0S84_12800 [Bacteroidales bacterium]|jgi:hypothetical protein|nr:hypothetical protein [Bacteroidales bacterium]